MGCDVREKYWFVGAEDSIKAWHDFLFPCSMNAYPQLEDMEFYDEEWNNIVFGLSEKLKKLIAEKYPIDEEKSKKTHLGFFMGVGEVKVLSEWACFSVSLDNRNSVSAYIFKELLDKYFHGVYMYYQYTGDSYLFNTYCSNDREMRFFDYASEGTYRLCGGWNDIGVFHDGNYTKEEIVESYRLYLGNTDINAKYPELKGTPHVIGTRKDGKPYLYRAVAYDKTVQIPRCIVDFDDKAFDFDVLYESSYDFEKEYGGKGYTLVLTDEQRERIAVDEIQREAGYFFDVVKSESGEVLYDKAEREKESPVSIDNAFPDDIPF